MAKSKRSNPLALAVLACLQERPMHPYEMATTMRSRGKHESIKLNYGSLYTVVQSLERAGLIAAQETEREGRRPERTVYALLDAGRVELIDWLSEMLSTPAKEFTQFEAGLSLLPCLPPEDVLGLLDDRAQALQLVLVAERSVRDHAGEQGVPGLFAVELRVPDRDARSRDRIHAVAGRADPRREPGRSRALDRLPPAVGQPARAGRGNGELTMDNAIEASDLTKTYGKGVRALDGLSFSASAGTVFALLGPNGAGKSTTIKILTTLSRPDNGEARVAGIDVLSDPARVRRAIGVVGQKASFDPVATGRENLVLQGQIYDVTGRRLKRRVDELLEHFGLTEAANRAAKTYSGGMARKLDIALGLLHEPAVLFLDEPTTGLDPEARSEMWSEISRLTQQEQMTILLTTHYLEEADELAAQLAIVDRGKVVAAGTPDELKSSLHGDSLHIELAAEPADGEVRRAVERVPGLTELALDGRQLRAQASDGATAMPSLLAALHESGHTVTKLSMSRPSLDDVYLRVAGRAFQEADSEQPKESAA